MKKQLLTIVLAALCLIFSNSATAQIPLKPLPSKDSLTNKETDLDEVQIIGYGQTTKRISTGSISTINKKQIQQQPVTNILSSLSGRIPGVFVQTTNGLPGGNVSIQIRGKGSMLTGTDPLYVIDGVPYEGNSINGTSALAIKNIAGAISPLNNLNPADIESITVLKDADATSIYGSRGANGVVLITTKKAQTEKTKINISLQQGLSEVADKPRLLSLKDYLEVRKKAFANSNRTPSSDPLSADYAPELTLWSQTEETDWIDYIFGGTANSTDLQTGISGTQGNTQFSVSGSFRHENTILPGSNNFRRAGLNSQLHHRSENGKFQFSLNNQLSNQANDLVNPSGTIHSTYLSTPNYPLLLPNGDLNWYSNNILGALNAKSKSRVDNNITNLTVGYLLTPQLNLKLNAGYTNVSYDQTLIFPTEALFPGGVNNSSFGKNNSRSLIFEPQVDYQLKFKSSSIAVLLGGTYQGRTNSTQYLEASNFKLKSLMEDLGSAGAVDLRNTTFNAYKYASVFGRITYNISDTYIFNATMRRDGSSRFGPGNRFGNFGSVGAAWLFSNLKFLNEKLPLLSFGKLRTSYGTTGNDQITDYQYKSTYSSSGTGLYQDVASIRPNRISNANFHWETTHKLDIGLELGLINDRIYLNANYYNNKSKDQLVRYALAQITGFADYQANLPAVVENKGWEFSAQAGIIVSKAFNWSINANLTLPKNQLKSFHNFETSSYALTYQLGYDITRIYGYKALEIDKATGKVIYAGQDGQPSTTPFFYNTLGKLTPDYYGGVGNTFGWKGLELHVFAQFVKQISRGGLTNTPGSSKYNNFSLLKDNWSPENKDAKYPIASMTNDFNFQNSAYNIFDTSYLRLKTAALSYQLPEKIYRKLKMSNARLFCNVQNLLTFWDKDAAVLDPESGAMSSTYGRNIPPLKTFSFGFQLTL